MTTQLKLPAMGEGVIEATIATWLKAEGDFVKQFEPIVEVETDKVTTEVVAENDGVLQKIMASDGETVAGDQVIALIAGENEAIAVDEVAPAIAQVAQAVAQANGHAAPIPVVAAPHSAELNGNGSYTGRVSPVVARMVKMHALDLSHIAGSGKNGRVTKRDVEAYLDQPAASPASAPATQPTPIVHTAVAVAPAPIPDSAELQPHSNMRRKIAAHMVLSKATSPHATTVHEIDYSAVKAHRKLHKDAFAARGVKLTYMAYLGLAVVQGLQAVPDANSSWREDGLLRHKVVNLGIAAAIDGGLVVPVVKDADSVNLLGMARAIGDLARKARANQLGAAEMQGGTFTITNHGVFGSLFATPIINQPQAGILGIGVVEDRVCAVNGMVAIRPKAYASFSFDHRVLNGADADRFMQVLRETLENWA